MEEGDVTFDVDHAAEEKQQSLIQAVPTAEVAHDDEDSVAAEVATGAVSDEKEEIANDAIPANERAAEEIQQGLTDGVPTAEVAHKNEDSIAAEVLMDGTSSEKKMLAAVPETRGKFRVSAMSSIEKLRPSPEFLSGKKPKGSSLERLRKDLKGDASKFRKQAAKMRMERKKRPRITLMDLAMLKRKQQSTQERAVGKDEVAEDVVFEAGAGSYLETVEEGNERTGSETVVLDSAPADVASGEEDALVKEARRQKRVEKALKELECALDGHYWTNVHRQSGRRMRRQSTIE